MPNGIAVTRMTPRRYLKPLEHVAERLGSETRSRSRDRLLGYRGSCRQRPPAAGGGGGGAAITRRRPTPIRDQPAGRLVSTPPKAGQG